MLTTPIDLHRLCTDFQVDFPEEESLPVEHASGVREVITHNVYEQACNITAWQQIYDQIRSGKFYGKLTEVWFEGIQFCTESTNMALRQSCMLWPGAIWFGFPHLDKNDNYYICHAKINNDCIAVCDGGNEFELFTPDDQQIAGVVVMRSELECFVEYSPKRLDELLPDNRILRVGLDKKMLFWDWITQILSFAQNRPDMLEKPSIRKILKDSLICSILDMLSSAEEIETERYSQQHYRKIVDKARDCIISMPSMPCTVLDLCKRLHVSRRTLQNAFQSILNISPVSYLKAIRLNAVRRELESMHSAYDTVQDAAAAWGFWHMSQFSMDYQRLFDERPSMTLKRRGQVLQRLLGS